MGDGKGFVVIAPGWLRTDMGGPNAPLGVEDSVPSIAVAIAGQAGRTGIRFLDYLTGVPSAGHGIKNLSLCFSRKIGGGVARPASQRLGRKRQAHCVSAQLPLQCEFRSKFV